MTQGERNEALRHIEVEKAYLEGKEIEYTTPNGDWKTCLKPVWNWEECDYRIKPEPQKPQYCPFKNANEFMEAIKEHGHFLRRNTTGNYRAIGEFNDEYVWLNMVPIGDSFISAFENYTFADGAPFGKLIEK